MGNTIWQDICEIVKAKFAVEKIEKDMEFRDAGLDSLDFVELIMELEEVRDISIEDDPVQDFTKFGELETYVENLK